MTTTARPYLLGLCEDQPLRDDQMLKLAKATSGKPELTVHGFRSTVEDRARNRTRFSDEVSEPDFAHVSSDAWRAPHACDKLLEQRSRLMEAWVRFLREQPAEAGEVVSTGQTA